jgi:hypothetical protein
MVPHWDTAVRFRRNANAKGAGVGIALLALQGK